MQTLVDLFESTVRRHGAAPALLHAGGHIDYDCLNSQANQLGRYLISHGVGPDTVVSLSLAKSPMLIVAILGVLKAGGAYLPIDPDYPQARQHLMLEDGEPIVHLGRTDAASAVLSPERVIPVQEEADRNPWSTVPADNIGDPERLGRLRSQSLMYVIYTSGSTGRPKGVAVTHEGAADLRRAQESLGVRPGHRVLQWASVSFDAAFWDITLALLSGATLVVPGQEELLPGLALKSTLQRYDITHAVLPPVALSATPQDDVLVGGTVTSTGDTCTSALIEKWAPGRHMLNGYGPTEVTVGATMSPPLTPDGSSSVGRPWAGKRVHILNERLDEVPIELEGDIYISGTGLARGYLNRSGLTAARFVACPAASGERMYLTGDRGFLDAHGELHFAGRADRQVKLRGFRVELGEVEAALTELDGVDLAVAVVHGEADTARLVGFVQPTPGASLDKTQITRDLLERLPRHMVPSAMFVRDSFPCTNNGKVDREALYRTIPEPSEPVHQRVVGDITPSSLASVEARLCALAADVLSVGHVTPQDSFFELGGHSILAARLAERARRDLGLKVSVRTIFEAQTIHAIARQLENAG